MKETICVPRAYVMGSDMLNEIAALFLLVSIAGGDVIIGPQLVTNIVVKKSKLRNERMYIDMYTRDKDMLVKCCDFITSGHEIDTGNGTVIATRAFHEYIKSKPETGMFVKMTIFLPYELKFDEPQGEILFDMEKGMIGHVSSGSVNDSKAWSCYAYVTAGSIKYKRLDFAYRVHIKYKVAIKAEKIGVNDNLECHDGEIEHSGYYYFKNVGDLDIWEGKKGRSYYDEASPRVIRYREFIE